MAFLAQAEFSPTLTPAKVREHVPPVFTRVSPHGFIYLLHQCLLVNNEQEVIVYVWRTRGPLHSFCSAFCCWFPACFTQHTPCTHPLALSISLYYPEAPTKLT